jgi:hypothetical protein
VVGRGGQPSPPRCGSNSSAPGESISFCRCGQRESDSRDVASGKGAPFSGEVAQMGGGGDVSTRGAAGRGGRSRSGGARGGQERRRLGESRSRGGRKPVQSNVSGPICEARWKGRVDDEPHFFGPPPKWSFQGLISGGCWRCPWCLGESVEWSHSISLLLAFN